MKKVLSFMLALVMVLSLLPWQASAAENATLTVSGNSYRNKYVVISDGTNDKLYYINNSNTVVNPDDTAATFAPGSYTVYYGSGGSWNSSFASGTVNIGQNASSASVTLRTARVSSSTAYATKELYATSLFHNATSFDHVDIRVEGSYVIHVGAEEYSATVSNPSVVVKVGGTQVASQSWTGTTSYEWRKTGLHLTKANVITVELTLDLTYTDKNGQRQTMEDVHITYDSVNNVDRFIDAIAICDMVMGLDFEVTVEDIAEEIQYHTVSYEWRVYNTDGSYTVLPAGSPGVPPSSSGHATLDQYVYDTEYTSGDSFYDYDNGLLYTFHGWDTYSHSDVYNVDPTATGYNSLEGNSSIEITGDTYIYGYWTVTELEPSSAHIAIEKKFIVDGVEVTLPEAEDLWFHIDTGSDQDGDGSTIVEIAYAMLGTTGEYKIPVYQYDTPYIITEDNADVPGYTRTTTITVSGDYILSSTKNGDSITVTMQSVYQGENVHLGTVTYTNSYTKNVGQAVHEFPSLILLKSAADTHSAQDGVVFTLYADAACQNPLATFTTANDGMAEVNFANIPGVQAGVYYLKETAPLAGYLADPYVYPITLTTLNTVEQLRGDTFVQVTRYGLAVDVPDGSTAAHQSGSNRLHIFNEPILGSLELNKVITGIGGSDRDKVNAAVIVHGPITRDGQNNITAIGHTWELTLNSENNWTTSLQELPLGEYLIHESFASVHGYTWTGVTYGSLSTTVYNNITSGLFRVEDATPVSLTLTNSYSEWSAADFYIKKVDDNGHALAGATFTLSTDPEGNNVVHTRTTGADGYAHFSGYTVPEGQSSATYYLREVNAPNGYYLSNQVYKVVITAITDGSHTSYEPQISLMTGRSNGFDIDTDLLTVTNFPVLGELTLTKSFTNGLIPDGLNRIQLQVSSPNGYSRTVELNPTNNWAVTLENLPLGQYTVSELNANVPGYTWNVSYSSATVTLAETTPGKTQQGADISAAVTVTNTYTRNEEFFDVPASLTVKKVDAKTNAPLAGAVFTLTQVDTNGNPIYSVSFTTGTNGTVVFDLLSGVVNDDGSITEGKYIISETTAPKGYERTDETWVVTVKEDDGALRVVLNANKNVFENFWDWIIGTVNPGSWNDGVLTVTNEKKLGSVQVTKEVMDSLGLYPDGEYSFTLDFSDNAFDKTFTLKNGESIRVDNIPWGTTYTLTEDTTGAAFTSVITDAGEGRVWANVTNITVTNTYNYTSYNQNLNLLKVDADDNTLVISGAGFTLYADAALTTPVGSEVFSDASGRVVLPITAEGTYYLAETTAPDGYHLNAQVYEVTAQEQVVVKNAGTAEAVTELQMHIRIQGLIGTTENNIDYLYSIENIAIKPVEVSVQKIWYGSGVTHPKSVSITLYRDGEIFDTVTLDAANQWTHTWTELTDAYEWTVDEPSVPSGYNKTVRRNGYSFLVINTHEDNPKTGDMNSMGTMAAMAGISLLAFGFTAVALMLPRKKEEEK